MYKTKVVIIGVGVGEKYNFFDKILYKIALKMANEIFVRDDDSLENLEKIFQIEANFIPDVAFYYDTPFIAKKKVKTKKLLVGIIEYSVFKHYAKEVNNVIVSKKQYIELWMNEVLKLSNNFDNIYFASTTPEDIEYSKELFFELKNKNILKKLILIEDFLFLDKYIDVVKEMDMVISARMHSLILAQVYGCEVKPWIVSKKLVSYKKEYINVSVESLQNEIDKQITKVLSTVI